MKGIQPDSVVGRLKRYFEDNPDEELAFSDICTKFSCTYAAAVDAVKKLKRMEMLESVNVIRTRKKGMGL